jgi:hypothetical protein
MTNSEAGHRAATVIKEVFELISEEYLQLKIDEAIEKAAASFEFDREAPVTHQTFTQIIRDFIRPSERPRLPFWFNFIMHYEIWKMRHIFSFRPLQSPKSAS